jgi:hypothetical protein
MNISKNLQFDLAVYDRLWIRVFVPIVFHMPFCETMPQARSVLGKQPSC